MKRAKILKIEWRHPLTVRSEISKVIKSLCAELKKKNVGVILTEKKSKTEEILFNDLPLEFLIDEARVRNNFCGTCAAPGQRIKKKEIFSEVLIKKAAFKAAGI